MATLQDQQKAAIAAMMDTIKPRAHGAFSALGANTTGRALAVPVALAVAIVLALCSPAHPPQDRAAPLAALLLVGATVAAGCSAPTRAPSSNT